MLLTITLILACIAMTTAVVAIAILLSPVGTLGLKSNSTENAKLLETQDALRVSQERFQLASEGSSNGLWDWDIKTNAVFYASRFKDLLGLEENEMENSFDAWKTRLHPEDLAATLEAVEAHLTKHTPFRVRYRLLCKSGSYRWFNAWGQAIWDSNGKATRMVGSITDISDQIDAELAKESTQRLYLSLVENLPAFLIRKDLEGRFTFANQGYCKQLGKSMEELRGTTDFDHYPRALAEKYREDDLRVARTGELFEDVEENVDATGHHFFEVLKTQVTDATGAVVGTQLICWDVTDRKLAEIALNEAKLAAEHANRAKSDFLANMSHEIRTPMNSIIGMTELVLESRLASDQREYLMNVMEAGESLLSIINEILDFSKIEAGRLQLENTRFDLREMLGSALKSLGVRAHKKGLELTWQCSPDVPHFVMGDPTRLRQIVFNLVGNSIKFTNSGEILLSVQKRSDDGSASFLEISVKDTGIGIAAENLEKIFDAFQQADVSTTRQFGGTGLGLAISRRLVQLMGGELQVDSALGHGSVFRFVARFEHAMDQSQAICLDTSKIPDASVLVVDDNVQAGSIRPLRVLLAEDGIANQKLALGLLKRWGHTVTIARNGSEAVEKCSEADFDVILMDVQMPVMDGLEATRTIRAREIGTLRHVPIIAVTAHAMSGDREKCLDAGMDGYVTKPFKKQNLYDALLPWIK